MRIGEIHRAHRELTRNCSVCSWLFLLYSAFSVIMAVKNNGSIKYL